MGRGATATRQQARFRACVLHADACDYTARLIANEAAAIAGIIAARRLIVGLISRYAGHVVDQSGDSVLAWFAHPGAAVECAIAIQNGLSGQSEQSGQNKPQQFRIGIALGGILKRGHQIFGTVVTDAARLQSLAAPGRIAVSPEVRIACGEHAQLMAAEPIRALLKPDEPVRYGYEVSPSQSAPVQARSHRIGHAPTVVIAPLMAPPDDSRAGAQAQIFLQLLLECIYREQAEAMVVEDFSQAFRTIEPDTGVPLYLVTGGIHTSGERTIVSVSVLHGSSRRLICAERASVEMGTDPFAELQSFAERIFRAIVGNELAMFQRMKAVPKGAFQLYARARQALGTLSPDGAGLAIAFLEECLRLEPDFARGWGLLGKAHSLAWRFSWTTGARDSLAQSIAFTDRALEIAPQDPVAMAQAAFALIWAREQARAQDIYARAIALGLSDPDEISEYAMILQSRNESAQAMSLLLKSLRTNPENADFRLWTLGDILFTSRRYQEALNALRRMKSIGQASRLAAASSARLGLDPAPYVREVLVGQPDFSVKRWISIQPLASGDELDDYSSALRQAGLPW